MTHRTALGAVASVSLIALLALAPNAGATPQELADFVGAWEIEMNAGGGRGGGRGGGPQVLTFMLDDDGKLQGTWGNSELADVSFEAGKVTFTRSFGGRLGGGGGGRGGGMGALENEVTIEDGKLVGKMTTPRGSMDYAGVRKDS